MLSTSILREIKTWNQMLSDQVQFVSCHNTFDSSIRLCPCSLSICSLLGLYPPAGVCANLYGTAAHQSWVAMATLGQKFYAVTNTLPTISCASHPSPTPLFLQGGVEVRDWLHRNTALSLLHWTKHWNALEMVFCLFQCRRQAVEIVNWWRPPLQKIHWKPFVEVILVSISMHPLLSSMVLCNFLIICPISSSSFWILHNSQ